jgi:colicin import membrane protein
MTVIRSLFVLPAGLVWHAFSATPVSVLPIELSAQPIVLASEKYTPRGSDFERLQRQRAENLARAASQEFTQILSEKKAPRLAQADAAREDAPEAAQDLDEETLRPVWDWLGRAAEAYEDVIVAKFRNPSGSVLILAPPGAGEPKAPAGFSMSGDTSAAPGLQPELSWGYVVQNIQEWLARANRSYRNDIVKELVEPRDAGTPSEDMAEPAAGSAMPGAAPAATVEAPAPAASPAASDTAAPAEPAASVEADASGPGASIEAAKPAEGTVAGVPAPERKLVMPVLPQGKNVADAAAAKRREAEKREQAEAKLLAEEAEAERKAVAESKRLADEAKRKAAEAKRLATAKAEAERKAAEDKAKRLAEKKRLAEEKDEAERVAAAEARGKAEEARRQAEAKRLADVAKREAAAAAARSEAEAAEVTRAAEAAKAEDEADAGAGEPRRIARAESAQPSAAAQDLPERKPAAQRDMGVPESAGPAKTPVTVDVPEAKSAKTRHVAKKRYTKKRFAKKRYAKIRHAKRYAKKRYAKKRWRKRHAYARGRKAARTYGYRYRRAAARQRAERRKMYRRGHRRICGKKYRRRHRASRRGGGRVYVVRKGDTLTRIARRHYGNGRAYRAIYRANRGKIRNPNRIYPRQRIYIP